MSARLTTKGFTIVELLVVIVVLGILVTIGVVSYRGLTGDAFDKTVLSDADSLDGIVAHYGLRNNTGGKEWYSGDGADPDLQFTPSGGNVVDIVINSTDYCIRVYNLDATAYDSLDNAAVKESSPGACGGLVPSANALADSPSSIRNRGVVTLFAGSTYGFANGTGAAAQFRYPYGVDVDSSGNVYIADHSNHRIRKITPTGIVSTLAGSTFGSTDGTGASAQFEYPLDVVVDSSGNAFVVEEHCRVRRVTPAGVVTTIAGSLAYNCGYVDATGSSARFNDTSNIAIDGSDNLYVADTGNRRIRKVTPDGTVTTLAGSGVAGYVDGAGTAAQFGAYFSVGADDEGNVYVSDGSNRRIRKVTPDGTVTTLAGSGVAGTADGVGVAAQFDSPWGIAVNSSGALYVGEEHRVRKIE